MNQIDFRHAHEARIARQQPFHNLPIPLTPFVGREAEHAHLIELLRDSPHRLVTITGTGGIGKTRLAVQAARDLVPSWNADSPFTHGVYIVPLTSLVARASIDEMLATSIANAIGMQLASPDAPVVQVQQYLRTRAMLLVLDNLEHLPSGASFLLEILQAAPALKLLVTSRERLNLRGEKIIALGGLAYPPVNAPDQRCDPGDYSAMQMFVQITDAQVPNFTLTAETAPAVTRICQLVEGLPLGIELAAHWTRVLACDDIADEIAKNLDFLTNDTHDLPERHRSLRAVFTSSWNLLTAAEQQALRQLAVFRGSFSREAANMTGVSLPLLTSLVDKSLVRRVALNGPEAAVRYEVPEVLRPYAFEQLAQTEDAAATVARHAAYYLDVLASHTTGLRGTDQCAVLAAINDDIEQIRAAWSWAATHRDSVRIARCADGLFHFYTMRSWFQEGADMFGVARSALESHTAEQAPGSRESAPATLALGKVLARQGWFIFQLGRQSEAREVLERSLTLLRSLDAQAEMVFALNYLAAVCAYLGDYPQTQALCRESLALALRLGDLYGQNVACNVLSQTAYDCGDYVTAQVWSQQSLAIEHQIGDRWSLAFSLANLGKVVYALGAYDEARCLFSQSLHTRREMGDTRGTATCLHWLGDVAVALGHIDEAQAHYEQSLALFREIGNRWGMATALTRLGYLALSREHHAMAFRHAQAALRLALDTRSLPQVLTIFKLFEQLVQHSREPELAAEIAQVVSNEPATLETCRPLAERLRTWSWAERSTECSRVVDQTVTQGQAIPLEQAMATLDDARPPAANDLRLADIRNWPEHELAQSVPGQPAGAHLRSSETGTKLSPTRHATQRVSSRHDLTPRELEVLRLVAQGLTDAEVAEQLVLSRRTVSTHLSTIYSKLQVKSRSAATRFALEHDLV